MSWSDFWQYNQIVEKNILIEGVYFGYGGRSLKSTGSETESSWVIALVEFLTSWKPGKRSGKQNDKENGKGQYIPSKGLSQGSTSSTRFPHFHSLFR